MLLGLDLQGGVHFLHQVDQKAALGKRLDAYAEDIRVALREARVAYESVARHGIDGTIVATLGEGADQDAAPRAILAVLPKIQMSMEGGGVVTATVPDAEVHQNITRDRTSVVKGRREFAVEDRRGGQHHKTTTE